MSNNRKGLSGSLQIDISGLGYHKPSRVRSVKELIKEGDQAIERDGEVTASSHSGDVVHQCTNCEALKLEIEHLRERVKFLEESLSVL